MHGHNLQTVHRKVKVWGVLSAVCWSSSMQLNIAACLCAESDVTSLAACKKKKIEEIGDFLFEKDLLSVKREKTNKMQQSDVYYQTSVSTCFGHHYAHIQENKDRVLLHVVCCTGSTGCGW